MADRLSSCGSVKGPASVTPTLSNRATDSSPIKRLARRLKQTARDAVWAVRGAGLRNPPWPLQVRSLLFVCHGNICRSPFAAKLAEHRLREAGGLALRCSSAGIYASPGTSPPPSAIEAAARFGVNLQSSRSILLTGPLVSSHDVVFVMEPAHLEVLKRRFPNQERRFFLLPHFADQPSHQHAYERHHLIDPFGQDLDTFMTCYERIDAAIRAVIVELTSRSKPSRR